MKFKFIFLFCVSVCSESFAQTPVDRCYFGSCIINFAVEPFQVEATNAINAQESPASICDNQGNLLFYTNGGPSPTSNTVAGIWDSNGQLMQNALPLDSAGCTSTYSGASIIPFPSVQKAGGSNYYMFTNDCIESSFSPPNYNSGLSVAIIDMSLNNGLGAVVSKHQTVVPFESIGGISTNDEPLAIISHSNDIDYWLFSYSRDSLYRLPVTTAGIGSRTLLFPASEGKIVFSPSRNHVILGKKLYQFNATTGDLNFDVVFPSQGSSAFSSDGTKLYRVEGDKLWQYDATSSTILTTKILIASNISSGIGLLFLVPNSSIYLCRGDASSIYGQIRCPNAIGTDCQFTVINQSLNGGITGSNSFTNFPANWLYRQTPSCNLSIIEQQNPSNLIRVSHTLNTIQLSSDSNIKWNIQLINSIGIPVFQDQFFANTSIQTEQFKDGIYFLVFESEDGNKEIQRVFILH